ncbi:MAG: electron transporter RnfD [Desulfatitalea sp. BRH_c12]|nr:MAG: electron transporter RnfD [Desulfatitalea sp. BRH_c12]
MNSPNKLIVSHAPFWHIGSGVPERNYNILVAALPAVLMGVVFFGIPAIGVICMAVSSAIVWEMLSNLIAKRTDTVADGHAALIGLIFGMLLPATAPWWLVITGTFMAIVIGKQIFGGIGANPFNPAVLSFAILSIAWRNYFDFDAQLVNFNLEYPAFYPLVAAKAFGTAAVDSIPLMDLFIGKEVGGLGSTSGVALMIGGIYLIARGFVRWEIPVAFIAGLLITAGLFHLADPGKYAGALFHLLTGYSLIAAFFLATEDSSSPVNTVPMLIYGAVGGVMTMLIRNIGAYPEGVIYAVLLINLMNPLIDKIRPKAIGKVA